jgi:hypothetical protein
MVACASDRHRGNEGLDAANSTFTIRAGLGLARIDFERGAAAGEVIYIVEGDSTPTSQRENTFSEFFEDALRKI